MSDPRVSLVVVSHSEKLAEGLRDLAQQMAPSVRIEPAGGRDDGGIGTSFDKVSKACELALEASGGRGAVILTDLGSARMVAESVIEFADDPDLLLLADGPLVEGAVVAAVAAEQRESLADVAAAAAEAGQTGGSLAVEAEDQWSEGEEVAKDAVIADPTGLHARPAAELVKMANVFDADIRVDGADAKSLMEVMALGRKQGETLRVSARGPQAVEAVENLVAAINAGFDK